MRPADNIARLLYSLGLNDAGAVAFRNRLVNGNFSIDQRGAANDPAVYESGAFIRDRWRAGATGCTAACAVASNGDTTIHIGAGSIVQHVEGGVYLPEGGSYCLSWQGDALGRVVAPTASAEFAKSPIVADDHQAGADLIVEFSLPHKASPVAVSLAQLEPGTRSTMFERRNDELDRCRRYFRRLVEPPLRGVIRTPKMAWRCAMALSPAMRSSPHVSLAGALYVLDGSDVAPVAAIAAHYSTADCLEVDLSLASELTVGRPALVYTAGQSGIVDVSADL